MITVVNFMLHMFYHNWRGRKCNAADAVECCPDAAFRTKTPILQERSPPRPALWLKALPLPSLHPSPGGSWHQMTGHCGVHQSPTPLSLKGCPSLQARCGLKLAKASITTEQQCKFSLCPNLLFDVIPKSPHTNQPAGKPPSQSLLSGEYNLREWPEEIYLV